MSLSARPHPITTYGKTTNIYLLVTFCTDNWFTLFSLYVSVKYWPLHKTLGKSQTYYPEHILGYGRLEDLLLSCHGFWLFLDPLSWWFLG